MGLAQHLLPALCPLGCRHLPTAADLALLPLPRAAAPKVEERRSTRIPPVPGGAHNRRTVTMNNDQIEGNWKQVKGKIKEQWGKLTDDDLDVIAGKRDQLLGRIQERHGIAKQEAEEQLQHFEKRNPTFIFEKSQ
jgi:uncharacterized protein YjbJ (UPF0337 family)